MLLDETQLQILEKRVAEAHLLGVLIAEVRHHRENAQVPIFVCPECDADEEYGFSCGKDYTGPGSADADFDSHSTDKLRDATSLETHPHICKTCRDDGEEIVAKTTEGKCRECLEQNWELRTNSQVKG